MNSVFYFVKKLLSKMTQGVALEDMFGRKFDKPTRSTTCMDTFTTRALTSPHFVRKGVELTLMKTEIETQKGEDFVKKNESVMPSPSTSPSWPDSSIIVKLCKPTLDKTEKTNVLRDDEQRAVINIESHHYLRAARKTFFCHRHHPI